MNSPLHQSARQSQLATPPSEIRGVGRHGTDIPEATRDRGVLALPIKDQTEKAMGKLFVTGLGQRMREDADVRWGFGF